MNNVVITLNNGSVVEAVPKEFHISSDGMAQINKPDRVIMIPLTSIMKIERPMVTLKGKDAPQSPVPAQAQSTEPQNQG